MSLSNVWKIGTRGSLLAVTQSQLILDKLSQHFPDEVFELEKIKTEGDLNTSKPLWQMDGKDFFTKELDDGLISLKTDMSIHSYKDLGSERPPHIELAAVTKRATAHDVLLLRKEVQTKLLENNCNSLVIGTSSPRRMANLPGCLEKIWGFSPMDLEIKMLRGNVPTRIQKCLDGDYDGIVCAAAGLERLASEEKSKAILEKLLKDVAWCFLPLDSFPPAAAQGSLAIEVYRKNPRYNRLSEILKAVHADKDAELIHKERQKFAERGGGCHLGVGIHAREVQGKTLLIERGIDQNQSVQTRRWGEDTALGSVPRPFFAGLPKSAHPSYCADFFDELVWKTSLESAGPNSKDSHFYLSSALTLPYFKNFSPTEKAQLKIWSAGSRTWKKAFDAGLWSSGCSDGLGDEVLSELLESPFTRMSIQQKNLSVLGPRHGKSSLGKHIEAYFRTITNPSEEFSQQIKSAAGFFWTSSPQFEAYLQFFPFLKDRQHFCGLGKTYTALKQWNLDLRVISSMGELRSLLKK